MTLVSGGLTLVICVEVTGFGPFTMYTIDVLSCRFLIKMLCGVSRAVSKALLPTVISVKRVKLCRGRNREVCQGCPDSSARAAPGREEEPGRGPGHQEDGQTQGCRGPGGQWEAPPGLGLAVGARG